MFRNGVYSILVQIYVKPAAWNTERDKRINYAGRKEIRAQAFHSVIPC
jgi:hypothetical protein